jgi:hypothetical protein
MSVDSSSARGGRVAERPEALAQILVGGPDELARVRGGAPARVDREIHVVLRHEPPFRGAQLELDPPQGRLGQLRHGQLDRAEVEHARGRDGVERDFLAVVAQGHGQAAALERGTGAVRHREPEPRGLAAPIGEAVPFRHDHRVGIDDAEQLVEHARVAAHVEEAVRLPMAVVQLRDHVAGELRLAPHGFDLVLQRAELLPLAGDHEAAQIAEHPVEAPVREAVLDAVGVHDALAPIVAGLEPPGLLAILLAQVLRIGQAPIAELRAHERLAAGDDRVAMGGVEPGRAVRELVHELVPIRPVIREGGVEVVIRDVGLHVEARRERRVVHDEAQGIVGLQPREGALEPIAVVRVVDEVDAPSSR